jgi:membrane dipeptidase
MPDRGKLDAPACVAVAPTLGCLASAGARLRPVFDGHHDALTKWPSEALRRGNRDGHFDLTRARDAALVASIWAIFTPTPGETLEFTQQGDSYDVPLAGEIGQREAAPLASSAAGRLLALERNGELRIARSVEDLDDALAAGVHAAVMHLEGAEAIDPGLDSVDLWYAAGLRSLGPVWSRPNVFGHGVPFHFPASPDTGPGLTDAGQALVRRCVELGIVLDLSHLNAAAFWDVRRLGASPLVASHSGAHALAPASRNLTDAQLDAIGESDGIVGIPFATDLVRADGREDRTTPVTAIIDHVRYVAERIGVDHVALGSDFDGATIPQDLVDVTGLPRLLDALSETDFSRDEVERIAYGNWRRVLASPGPASELPVQA